MIIGSVKLYASFAKEPCKRDYILPKRPVTLRSLLIVATPYVVTTVSRIDKIIGLFCRIASLS